MVIEVQVNLDASASEAKVPLVVIARRLHVVHFDVHNSSIRSRTRANWLNWMCWLYMVTTMRVFRTALRTMSFVILLL